MNPPSRHASPIFVRDGQPSLLLERLELGGSSEDGRRREAFVQNLVHDHPDLIPMADIEPAFAPLISICKELETSAGYVDNFWLTPAGGIVLGECKLVRNPQARREVVVQALDYARALCDWHYEDLQSAVRKALKSPGADLFSLLQPQTDLEEQQFVDAVERRLRTSRFLILIIGDGIQEGVEALTSYLQLHAGMHAAVALLDLSIWRGIDGGLIVVPRIPLRTVLVERGIVTVASGADVRIDPPAASTGVRSDNSRPFTVSEPEFYDQLEQRRPGLADRLRAFADSLVDVGVTPEFRKSLILRWPASPDVLGSAGYVDTSGKAWLGQGWTTANRLGMPTVGEQYLNAVAQMVGGMLRTYKYGLEVVGPDGRGLDVAALLDRSEEWKSAISQLISETRSIDR